MVPPLLYQPYAQRGRFGSDAVVLGVRLRPRLLRLLLSESVEMLGLLTDLVLDGRFHIDRLGVLHFPIRKRYLGCFVRGYTCNVNSY